MNILKTGNYYITYPTKFNVINDLSEVKKGINFFIDTKCNNTLNEIDNILKDRFLKNAESESIFLSQHKNIDIDVPKTKTEKLDRLYSKNINFIRGNRIYCNKVNLFNGNLIDLLGLYFTRINIVNIINNFALDLFDDITLYNIENQLEDFRNKFNFTSITRNFFDLEYILSKNMPIGFKFTPILGNPYTFYIDLYKGYITNPIDSEDNELEEFDIEMETHL